MASSGSGRTPATPATGLYNAPPIAGVSPVPFPGFSPATGQRGPSPATPSFAPRPTLQKPVVERLAGLSGSVPVRGLNSPSLQSPPLPPARPGSGRGTPATMKAGAQAAGAKRVIRGKAGSPSPGGNMAMRMAEATPAARRKKRKLAEAQLSDRVATFIPESRIYSQLLDFEKKVDATIARKKLDIQEALKMPQRVSRTLRLYIISTYDKSPGLPPETTSWCMTITGRLLEDGVTAQNPGQAGKEEPLFTSFFKKVTIQLDPSQYPGGQGTMVWEASKSVQGQKEAIEVKRLGKRDFKARITLEMAYEPERFKVAPRLAALLKVEVETRARIIAALWQYIKEHKLQDPSDPTMVVLNAPLKEFFGPENRIKLASITSKISPLLSPAPAIVLEQQIRLSGPNAGTPSCCYDIAVDIPPPIQKDLRQFLAGLEKHRDIELLDENIRAAVKKVNDHRRRRAFFLGFSHSPVDFINGLMASQGRDLKLAAGAAGRNADKESRSESYKQPWVEDAVVRYLNRRLASGLDAGS